MSKTPAYIITSISGSLNQRNKPVFSQGLNNLISLREKYAPYTVLATKDDDDGDEIPKFPLGRSGSY
jgi:hypothetical protein